MHSCFAPLVLPYTRTELPGWGKLLQAVGAYDWWNPRKGDADRAKVVVRGKEHGFLMTLDRSDWAQRLTYFLGRYYELGVLRTLDALLRPGDNFVDIGANIGMIALHARFLVGSTGRVDCFEPNPECVESIRAHTRVNGIQNVVVHPFALAGAPGSLTLHLMSAHSGTATLADVGNAVVRSMDVRVEVGDDVLAVPPRVVKIDVEGYELHVLEGLRRTLSQHKPFLIMEVVESHLRRANTSSAEVFRFLSDMGYGAYGIDRRRRHLRYELALRPLKHGGTNPDINDVLWTHEDQALDLTPYLAD